MAIIPRMVIPAPEPRGLRYGLFTAANGPNDLPPHGAAGGVTYDPVSCGHAHYYGTECHGSEKTFDANDELIKANPFVVYASLVCGSAGTTASAMEAKVRRRLANGEQTIAEYGMGLVLGAGATPLASPDPTMTGVVSDLEQWLYGISGANYGNIGYLHASPRMAAYAAEESLIVRDGPLLKTPMGTIWVFGGGYPDNGTIYVSGQVTVWRSADVFVSSPAQTLNLTTNQYRVLAEREYAVAYDCVAASAVFDWTPLS
jgi:hypothetical protein